MGARQGGTREGGGESLGVGETGRGTEADSAGRLEAAGENPMGVLVLLPDDVSTRNGSTQPLGLEGWTDDPGVVTGRQREGDQAYPAAL